MNNFAYYILNKAPKDKLAIIDDRQSITYGKLADYVVSYAAYLKEQKLSYGSRIILSMPDSIEWCVAFLACIYIGAIPILISSQISKSLLKTAAKDCSADYLITNVTLSKKSSQLTCHSYTIDAEGFWLTSSGTTGHQKYIIHKHQSLLEYFNLIKDIFQIDSASKLFASPRLSFGYGFGVNIILGLGHGASIVLTNKVLSHKVLSQRIQTLGITHFFSTPIFLSSLINQHNKYSDAIKSLKIITSAGESLPKIVRDKFKEIYNQHILNGYGLSETLSYAITQRPDDSDSSDYRVIGRVISNVNYEIRDLSGNKCSIGTTGELYLNHPCAAVNYYNDTNNSTFQLPWIKTNDLVFENNQGEIVYVCRQDNLIKIKGMYVVIDELEGIIMSHPQINECLVSTYKTDQGLLELTANIVVNTNITTGDIRRYLKNKVEPHQVPKKIVFVESLIKTVTNKKVRQSKSLDKI
jgi:benzoate-CoA ligase